MLIFNNVFDELNNFFYGEGGYKSFPVDMVEIKNGFKIIAEMPGIQKEDIQMNFEDGILTIEADRKKDENEKYLINERDTTHLKRSISFGEIHEDSIEAKLENGLLTITILTKAPEEKPKRKIIIE
ncbi:MAG: Hsp20 family protein [Roseburia sp.]|nr:Hsp20 family protein [Anaeroplasma bactoclasticum]MCM1196600.1 Hsp20 family protein [Roseburia sp.]MCM1556161.1 Hsp20 family protein [Anaeroplasma bactoclasticum]